jgi:hypothetical protein
MWSTLAGGHLMKVVNLTGFTVIANWVIEKQAVRMWAGLSLFPDKVNGLN